MGLTASCGFLNAVIGQPDAGELPAGFRGEKVSIAGPDVRFRSYAGTSAKYHLVAHEFSIVLTESARRGLVAVVGQVGAGGPFPDVAKNLLRLIFLCTARSHGMETAVLEQIALYFELRGSHFPLEFGGQASAGPAGKSIGFV